MSEQLPFSEACERNKEPILKALRFWLPATGTVLEIGSGTGQHVVYFAREIPGLSWQPTDLQSRLPGLEMRIGREGGDNILGPAVLDVRTDQWPRGPFAAVFSANSAHIMAWSAVARMIEGVARVLAPDGCFFLYGPFHDAGRHTAPSNAEFDQQLRAADPSQGVRDAVQVRHLAADCGLLAEADLSLPANNRILIFRNPEHSAGTPGRPP